MTVTSKSGEKFEGWFSGFASTANSTKLTLKMVKKLANTSSIHVNGATAREAAFIGSSPDYAMNFDLRDVAEIAIPEFSLPETTKLTNGRRVGPVLDPRC